MTIRTVSESQDEILAAIRDLHAPGGFDCDLTFGNGTFWRNMEAPRLKYDIDPQDASVIRMCSTAIQQPDASIGHTVFDPPFLTYVREAREGNGKMALARRYSGYWTYDELAKHYSETLLECSRVIRPGFTLTFKCQDIVHNHALQPTHCHVVQWAQEVGFRLKDMFILSAKHRMPSPNRAGKQKHARIFHSYFLVFQRLTERQEHQSRAA